MTNITYEKQTINWERKQTYRKYERTKGEGKTFNKKKAARYGFYTRDPIAKYGVKQQCIRCEDYDEVFVA